MTQATVRITDNFNSNLNGIAEYHQAHESSKLFDRHIQELFDIIIPNLETFPKIGMDFLSRVSYSIEALNKRDRMLALMAKEFSIR